MTEYRRREQTKLMRDEEQRKQAIRKSRWITLHVDWDLDIAVQSNRELMEMDKAQVEGGVLVS